MDEFHRNRNAVDGRLNQCKPCRRPTLKAWKRANRDRVNAGNRSRTVRKPEVKRNERTAWSSQNPEKVRAHRAVHWAIRRGDLVRPGACEACGETKPVQAHHHDYGKPLDVRWLCSPCHAAEHHASDAVSEAKLPADKPVVVVQERAVDGDQ